MIARVAHATLLLLALSAAAPGPLRERRAQLDETRAEAEATATAIRLITARIAANEVRAAGLRNRILELDRVRSAQRAQLAARQSDVHHLLAALQTLSRRPSALMLVQPQSAADTARVSVLLATLRPQLHARTAELREMIDRSSATRRRVAVEQAQLGSVQAALARDVARLEGNGQALAARTRSLEELVDTLARRGEAGPQLALAAPATGRLVARFGSRNELGVTSQGLSWRTAARATVTAPADGRVVFTGPYRTYGRIVIIEHSGGVLSLLAGLEAATVAAGQPIRTGGEIGRMGAADPVLYFEVRSDGTPVNPLPWLRKSSQG